MNFKRRDPLGYIYMKNSVLKAAGVLVFRRHISYVGPMVDNLDENGRV